MPRTVDVLGEGGSEVDTTGDAGEQTMLAIQDCSGGDDADDFAVESPVSV